MAQPTPSSVHVDAALTDFSIAYMQDEGNFVADKVFAAKPVIHQSDKFYILDKDDFRRDDAVVKRAPGAAAPRSGFTLSTDSYSAESWWTSVPLSDLVVRNSDPGLALDEAATKMVTQRMLIRRERQFMTDFFGTGIWGTDVVGGTDFTVWSDYASDPEKDIDTGQEAILKATGQEASGLLVSYSVHKALKRHPIVKDKYKYTSSESITADMIARALELDRYLVAKASYNSNAEGASEVTAFAAGNNALLFHVNDSPSLMEPCAGAIFNWSGLTGNNDLGVAIDQYYDQNTKEDIVRGEFAFDMKVTGSGLGYFFSGAI